MIITCCHCGAEINVEDGDIQVFVDGLLEMKKLGWYKVRDKWKWGCPHCLWDGKIKGDEKCL